MFRFKSVLVFLLVLGLGLTQLAGRALAQEEEAEAGLEELLFMEIPVVTSATLSEQTLDAVPGSMTVITQEQIRTYGLRCLADVYEYLPGFYVEQSMFGHLQPKARLATQFKLMVDGHPVNDAYDRYAEPYDYYPLENVKQIEVIRGPGASLWGEDSFVALVNIITNKDKRTIVSVTGGEWDHFSANLVHTSDPDQDFSYSLQYNMLDENGDQLYFPTDFRRQVSASGYWPLRSITPRHTDRPREMEGGTVRLTYKDLTLTLEHRSYQEKIAEGWFWTQTDDLGEMIQRTTYADLEYTYDLSDTNSLYFKASYDQDYMKWVNQSESYGFNFYELPAAGFPSFLYELIGGMYYWDPNNDGLAEYWPEGAHSRRYFNDERFNFDVRWQTQMFEDHDVTLGFHWRRDQIGEVGEQTNVDHINGVFPIKVPNSYYTPFSGWRTKATWTGIYRTSSPCWLQPQNHSEDVFALYLQDIWEINQDWTAVLGTRWDDYDLAGSQMSPRIALIWRDFFDLGQILKLTYAESFIAPSNYDRYRTTWASWDPNEMLVTSATQVNYEVALQNPYEERFHYTLTYYQSDTKGQLSTWTASFGWDNYSRRGCEFEATWVAIDNLINFWGNYTHSYGFNNVTNTREDDYRNWGNAGFTLALGPDLNFSSYAHFQGKRTMPPGGYKPVDAWVKTNLSIVYTGIPNTDIFMTARNLTDKNYYVSNIILGYDSNYSEPTPCPGRQILVTVTHRF